MINVRKAAIIGCGFVGSSIAFSLMQRGLYSELVLIDADRDKAAGEAMDLSHGLPYAAPMQIHAGTYDETTDCSMVILAAGASQKPGETRLDLIGRNIDILRRILPELTGRGFQGILLVVSNPVDVLTYAAWRLSGLPASPGIRLRHSAGYRPPEISAGTGAGRGQPQRPRRHSRRARGQ